MKCSYYRILQLLYPLNDAIFITMIFGTFNKFGALNSKPVFEAFSNSVKDRGWIVSEHNLNADVAVIWSVLWNGRMKENQAVWDYFKNKNKPIIVLEIGGLNRGFLWKIGINGVNGSAYFGPSNNDDQRRKQLGIKLKPWKQGKDIVICCQHTMSQQWENMPPIDQWLHRVILDIRKRSNRRIIVRSHPRLNQHYEENHINIISQTPQKIPGTYDSYDFENALQSAWAVVNWNSNPASQAVINGVPAFVGPNSLAAPVGNLNLADIENPQMPDREQWLNDLVYNEWSLDEISQGIPLDRLSQALTSWTK